MIFITEFNDKYHCRQECYTIFQNFSSNLQRHHPIAQPGMRITAHLQQGGSCPEDSFVVKGSAAPRMNIVL